MARRPNNVLQERATLFLDHAALTTSAGVKLFKAYRACRIDAVRYINPTGLAENSTNAFAIDLRKTGADMALVNADDTFVAEADDNLCTAVAHGLQTGDGPFWVSNSGGALPTGLVAATDYYIIRTAADTFSLAASRALAFAGTAIDITADGTGTQTISDTASTTRPVTVASGIDTDSDEAGTNTLAADTFVSMTLTDANVVLDADDELILVFTEDGTATLPAGRLQIDLRYI